MRGLDMRRMFARLLAPTHTRVYTGERPRGRGAAGTRMTDDSEHRAFVEAWLRTAGGATVDQLVALFEEAFDALWSRAYVTLGEVTLIAIVDRVVIDAGD